MSRGVLTITYQEILSLGQPHDLFDELNYKSTFVYYGAYIHIFINMYKYRIHLRVCQCSYPRQLLWHWNLQKQREESAEDSK